MAEKFTDHRTFIIESCYNCGVLFGMDCRMQETLLRDGKTFYCPNGHGQIYTNATVKQLEEAQKALAAERARHDQTKAHLKNTNNRLNATKGLVTRTKRRLAKGICPCCMEKFSELGKHMAEKHPEYEADDTK